MYLVAVVMLLSFNSCEQEASLKKVLPIPTPSMNWGASERTIEKEMTDLGYRLEVEDSGKNSRRLYFSYDHERYYVVCKFIYSEYASLYIEGLRKGDATDLIDWLDKHYTEEAYARYEGGTTYLYKSKDDKSWARVTHEDGEAWVYWGSMKYGADIYEGFLEDILDGKF